MNEESDRVARRLFALEATPSPFPTQNSSGAGRAIAMVPNSPELRYAAQQERIRGIIKQMFREADVSFDTRFKPVGITFTMKDERGRRIGFFGGVITVSEFERMTDQNMFEAIRERMRFDSGSA